MAKAPAPAAPQLPSPREILEREAVQRRPAAFGASFAVILTVVAIIIDQLIQSAGVPTADRAADLVETLSAQAAGTSFPASFWTAYAKFKIDHGTATILAAGLRGFLLILLVPIVLFLMRAARERGGTVGKWMEPLAVAGLVAVGVATALQGPIEISAFKSTAPAFVPKNVLDTLNDSDLLIANGARDIFGLFIAIPLAMTSLQAMRVGLLPKILGFMGVLVGILFVLGADQYGVLRAIWFGAVAFHIMGRLPGGMAPAWAEGIPFAPLPRQPPMPREPKAKGGGSKGAKADAASAKEGKGKGPKLTK